MIYKTAASLFLLLLMITFSFSQSKKVKSKKESTSALSIQTELYKEIFRADSSLFAAFNRCDSISYKHLLTEDLEFYHDQGGLHYLEEEMLSIKEMCARNSHIRRELLISSLEVHPLGNSAAVEIGTHRFFHTNQGETEHLSGDYQFVQVWQKQEGTWKLKRVISYGHENMNNH